jgi:hypothetical protein
MRSEDIIRVSHNHIHGGGLDLARLAKVPNDLGCPRSFDVPRLRGLRQ